MAPIPVLTAEFVPVRERIITDDRVELTQRLSDASDFLKNMLRAREDLFWSQLVNSPTTTEAFHEILNKFLRIDDVDDLFRSVHCSPDQREEERKLKDAIYHRLFAFLHRLLGVSTPGSQPPPRKFKADELATLLVGESVGDQAGKRGRATGRGSAGVGSAPLLPFEASLDVGRLYMATNPAAASSLVSAVHFLVPEYTGRVKQLASELTGQIRSVQSRVGEVSGQPPEEALPWVFEVIRGVLCPLQQLQGVLEAVPSATSQVEVSKVLPGLVLLGELVLPAADLILQANRDLQEEALLMPVQKLVTLMRSLAHAVAHALLLRFPFAKTDTISCKPKKALAQAPQLDPEMALIIAFNLPQGLEALKKFSSCDDKITRMKAAFKTKPEVEHTSVMGLMLQLPAVLSDSLPGLGEGGRGGCYTMEELEAGGGNFLFKHDQLFPLPSTYFLPWKDEGRITNEEQQMLLMTLESLQATQAAAVSAAADRALAREMAREDGEGEASGSGVGGASSSAMEGPAFSEPEIPEDEPSSSSAFTPSPQEPPAAPVTRVKSDTAFLSDRKAIKIAELLDGQIDRALNDPELDPEMDRRVAAASIKRAYEDEYDDTYEEANLVRDASLASEVAASQ